MKTNPSNAAFYLDCCAQSTTEKEFFTKETPVLTLSVSCQHLKDQPTYAWIFQLITLHQKESRFSDAIQQWEFVRIGSEVWVSCFSSEGTKLVNRSVNIFEHVSQFINHILYVSSGNCSLAGEYESSVEKLLTA